MADPHLTPELDAFDRLTVRLYRSGLCGAAIALLAATFLAGRGQDPRVAAVVVTVCVAVSVSNLHLYDKRIRWLVGVLGVLGPVLLAVAPLTGAARIVSWAGIGFSFAALSALAIKEGFCFRVPGVRLVPLALAASLLPILGGKMTFAAPLLGLAAVVVSLLAMAKLRMPLSHDIGDRSAYQH